MIAGLLLLLALEGTPELPRSRVDTSYPAPSGRTLRIAPGASLQAALDAARPRNEPVLEAGIRYPGPFTLPKKSGAGWIVVRTSAAARLPASGTRVTPTDADKMPKLESRGGSVLSAAPGAHHYRFVGGEVRPAAGAFLFNVVLLESNESSTEQQPHHLVFDRCYTHFELKNARRVRVAGNVFEQNRPDAQNGFAILFTVRNPDGRSPWSVVEDVTFESNLVRKSAAGINILGRDDNAPSGRTRAAFFPGGLFRRNVIVGDSPAVSPEDNLFPKLLDAVGFSDPHNGDYRSKPGSAFRDAGSDGRDVGVDMVARDRALGRTAAPALLTTSAALFWVSVLLLAYANLGYPLLLRAWAALFPRPFRSGRAQPAVTILIAAHNEADAIAARLDNLLTLDYPPSQLEIVVGLDGCDDATAERARAHAGAGVRIVEFEERRGKPAVLNALVALARSEIVVFADARQRFEPDALCALVAPFADPQVGAVTGELLLADGQGRPLERGLGLYWRCEKAIRRGESRVGSVVGVTGAIYAIRRRLFEALPPDTILDDVWLPMRIARAGQRVVFEPLARAWDSAPGTPALEFARKVRTISGGFQLFAREPWLLGASNPLWLQTVSHKALRLLTPLLMLVALGANLALLERPFFRALMALQLLFYAAALLGHLLRRLRMPGLSVPYAVCLLACATVVGFVSFLTGRQRVTWARPARRPA